MPIWTQCPFEIQNIFQSVQIFLTQSHTKRKSSEINFRGCNIEKVTKEKAE